MVRTATSTVAAGGSASVDLMLQKNKHVDPAHAAISLPLVEWAVRVNPAEYSGDRVTIDKHRKAWEAARNRLADLNEKKA